MKNAEEFWTEHHRLFDGHFAYFDRTGQKKTPVGGKYHVADEHYFDVRYELVPITKPSHSFVRESALLADRNMTALWQSLEDWLRRRFPDTQTIITPFSDPLFDAAEYQEFLGRLGFAPTATGAFGKQLSP